MEPKFQSSFIPKGPIAPVSTMGGMQTRAPSSIFGYFSVTVFIITVAASIAVFGYQRYLVASIGTMGDNLNSARTTLEPDVINQLVKTSERIQATGQILQQHTKLSPIFDYLEANTLKSVSFTDFEFDTTDKGLSLTMKGVATSYSAVALQSAAFNQSKLFQKPIFSNLDLDNKGNVIFVFQANINPALLSYAGQFTSARNIAPPPVPNFTQTSTSTGTSTATVLKSSIPAKTSTSTKTQ